MERKIYQNLHCKTKQFCKWDCKVIPLLNDLNKAGRDDLNNGVPAENVRTDLNSGVADVRSKSVEFQCPSGEADYQIYEILGIEN